MREAFRQVEAQHLVIALPPHSGRVAPFDTHKEIAGMRDALELVAGVSHHLARIELALIEGDKGAKQFRNLRG